jgi:hypothetical protein
MSCCGEIQTAPMTDRHRVRVRYLGGRPISVQGTVTKMTYRFSGIDRIQLVDPRDAVSLLRNSLFRTEGVVVLGTEETLTGVGTENG